MTDAAYDKDIDNGPDNGSDAALARAMYAAAVNMLALREHSEKELRDKLVRKFANRAALDEVISRLIAQGYLSDSRFAETAVRHYAGKGYGPGRIRMELRKRGVNPEEQEAVQNLSAEDFIARARDLAARKYGSIAEMDFKQKRRALAFLARRGFSGEQCLRALSMSDDDFGADM